MRRSDLLALAAALAYGLAYHVAYVVYLHPAFEYASFDRVARPDAMLLSSLILGAAPVLARSRLTTAPAMLAALIYALYFIPTIWSIHHDLQRPAAFAVGFQLVLAACMAAVFLASRETRGATPPRGGVSDAWVTWATVAALAVIAFYYRSVMRFVGFDEVYDVRFASHDVAVPTLLGYATMWCSYCLLPYLIARGLRFRDGLAMFVGLGGSVIIYMAHGAKAALFTPAIMVGLYLLIRSGGAFFWRLLAVAAVTVLVLVFALPGSSIMDWARSIALMRMLGNSGWTTVTYYEYFSSNGYTYYSHVGAINALTGDWSHGPLSMGQLIGIEISGSEASNFNAGFWASDGVAALGVAGLPIATGLVIVFLRMLAHLARSWDRTFVALWVAGFAIALLNIPFTTAMASGGGALMLAMLATTRLDAGRARRATSLRPDEPAHEATG